MHGRVLLLLTVLFMLLITDTIAQFFAADYNDISCSPCAVQYIISGRSELLRDIARKCGHRKPEQKYNVNAHHILEKGSDMSLPCPLGLKATYHQNSTVDYVNQFKPFSSSRRLEGEITIPGPGQHPRVSRLETSISTKIQDPGFIGCGICGDKYEPSNGDTIKSVAEYCNTTEKDLKEKNLNLTDENITSFQAINISCNGTDYINNCSTCGSWHYIESDETLYILANTCNISLEVLEQANLGIDWDNVYPGQYINIPCMNPNLIIPLDHCGPCGIEYNAMEEVSIENVSKTCSVNTNNLMALNPSLQGPNMTTVPIGARLRLPCGQDNCGPCGSLFTNLDGQDLSGVAAKCHVGTIALQLENKGVNFVQLRNNTNLKIPCNTNHTDNPVCSKCSPNVSVKNDTDTYGIANMCNVSTDLIIYANSISSENELIPRGKLVYVPCASVPSHTQRTCTICGASIKLRTFVKIEELAVLCNTTRNAITDANPQGFVIDNPGVGDTLMLPCNSSYSGCGPCGISYIVTDENESLQSVAVKCAIMAEDIQSANPGINFTQGVPVDTLLDMPCSLLGSSSGARCSEFLQRPANLLLRILFYKPLMASVFSIFVLVL